MDENKNNQYDDLLLKKLAMADYENDQKIYDKFNKDKSVIKDKDKLDHQILSMISSERRKNKSNIIRKIRFIAATILIIFAVTFITVDAFRFKVYDFYMYSSKQFSSLVNTDMPNYTIGYIPDGYELQSSDMYTNYYKWVYIKDDNKINIYCYDNYTDINIDTEKAEKIPFLIGGKQQYLYVKEKNKKILVFDYDGHIFTISTNLDDNTDIVRIAEGIKIK